MANYKNIFQKLFSFEPKTETAAEQVDTFQPTPLANFGTSWSGFGFSIFDGEKTPYELGNPSEVVLDYYVLRQRAWESYIKSDIIQNAIKKYCLWIVGAGLKLQASPVDVIINDSSFKNKDFTKLVEARFRLYANSKESVYNNMMCLHDAAAEALKNGILAGDVLIIQRYETNATIEIIDGHFIQTPLNEHFDAASKRGNKIINGVEIDSKGKHIAFYVSRETFQYDRVEAYGSKTGRLQAWLMYPLKHKINDTRGMNLLTAVMETSAKLDRYKEATLGTAEENSKLVYTVQHNQFSTGENPLVKQMAQSFGRGVGTAPETDPMVAGENVASKIAQSTEKQAYNLPIGAELSQHGGKVDIHFGEFYGVNADLIYATLGIPPEVAADKFGGAYSGSRAALKSWEYKMTVDRTVILNRQFYKPFFDFWLDFEILKNEVSAPGYLEALMKKDFLKLEAYRNCRFTGAGVPHIDPLKEVNAERKKLGAMYDNVPLTSGDNAVETLGTGDFDSVIETVGRERELYNRILPKPETENDDTNDDANEL